MRFWRQTDGERTWWYLRGLAGAVQFMGALLREELPGDWRWEELGFVRTDAGWFMPMDLGYHSPTGPDEDEQPYDEACPVLEGPCFYGGSSLNALPVAKAWAESGFDDATIQGLLAVYYRQVFGVDPFGE